jgi:D-alanyl-D-alanine carboxypeptidase-like protein
VKLWIGLAALAALVAVGLVVAAGGEGEGERRGEGPAARSARAEATPPPRAVAVVWGIDDAARAARRLARHPAIERTALVGRGAALLRSARAAGGRVVQRVPAGYGIPLDVVSVEPRDYAAVLPPEQRQPVARLRRGQALLSRTSARLRRVGEGGTLHLEDGRLLRVVSVVPDEVAQFSELLVARSEGVPSARDSVVTVLAEGADVSTNELARAAGGDGRARLIGTSPGDAGTQPLRGPARQAELKARFGEPMVALPYGDDWVRLDPAFLRRRMVTRQVPVLGSVSCHRKMLPALDAAMRELDRRGLARLVDPGDYAGCYAPRRIRPGGALSLHAWGLAVDLNARANPFGGRSRQDRRLVRVMERHGFTWGGEFPTTPDPMHFEFRGRQADR